MRLESVYLLAGPEQGRRAAFIEELRGSIASADGTGAEEHRLYAQENSVGELLALLRNGALFSTRRLVEYRGAELAKAKDDVAALVAYVARPAPDAILLLETDSFYLDKALEEAIGKSRKKTFFELFENEKPRWIEQRLRELGLGIEEDAIESLLELIENDTSTLETACSRLSLLFPRGTVLGAEEVEAAVARNRQEDAFSLFGRMVEDETAWALESLDTVLSDRQNGAIPVLAALIWSFRRLLRLRLLVDGGENFESACLKSGIRAKSLQGLHRRALGRYSRAECERILRLACDTDTLLRASGSALERSILELFVYGAMERKGELNLAADF